MEPFVRIAARAVSLPVDNIDTDAILPARFGVTVLRSGFDKAFFADMRLSTDFPLNRAGDSRILVAGANYGCGAARETAVWAHLQAGFRCIIAPSFAGIFRANATRNGLLPVTLPAATVGELHRRLAGGPQAMEVDLEGQRVTLPGGGEVGFEIAADDRHALLNGLDPIDRTLLHESEISAFQFMDRDLRCRAWPKKRV
jgi:3-isopropylmalate/(R)-2-methylmalate dehydratase small subunit